MSKNTKARVVRMEEATTSRVFLVPGAMHNEIGLDVRFFDIRQQHVSRP